jgi:nucleotide-binding universal stress UspA family protein
MTILVGYPLKRRAKAVLSLAGMLSRTSGQDLLVCVVIPAPWMPGLSRADQGYRAYIDELVDTATAQAREDLPADVKAEFVTVAAKSAPNGLLEAAMQHEASVIVTGSSDSGQFGYISLSSVADRLLHSSHIPVAVAPRGFRASGSKIKRITLAFTGGSQSALMLKSARALAAEYGCELRLASFAVHLSPPETARFRDEHSAVLAEWTDDIYAAAEKALAPSGQEQAPRPEIVIGHGRDWDEAFESIEWEPGEVLVIGSSETGPVARVFLGSRATKIVRHAPVPVIVVPRAAVEEYAEEQGGEQ